MLIEKILKLKDLLLLSNIFLNFFSIKSPNAIAKRFFSIALVIVLVTISYSESFGSTGPVIQMKDSVNSYGATTNSANSIQAEFASSTSSLVGKSIDTIIVGLNKVGSPSGTIQVGVFNNDLSVKQLFGTRDASSLSTSNAQYSFSLSANQTYVIKSGDRIGIKFTGGSSSNYVDISIDQTNSFDGTKSYLTYYTSSWQSSTGKDLAMTLVLKQGSSSGTGGTGGTGGSVSDIVVKPPVDILSVTTNSSRHISNLGTPTVTDKNDPNPVVTNNSPGTFPVGITIVTWHATDSKGHTGQAQQKVTIISASQPANQFNRVAMINFDDDFASEYILGKPILDKYNIKMTLYVICGKVNEQNYMTWSMIHSMQSDGQDIQAHTMNHLNSNLLSQKQLDYEYGKDIACLKNNGTSGVHVVAMPFNEGFNNPKVINTIAKYFDFARGINRFAPNTFYLHCNEPEAHQTNCKTYDSSGHLNLFNRYTIPAWSSDLQSISDNFNDAQSFAQFIKQVNKASTNTNSIPTEIPIVYYHRVVTDNSAISDVSHKGTSTILLDAEMKYLVDNHFKIRTTKDLGYDTTKNWFFFKS